jgi:hypothetical protein
MVEVKKVHHLEVVMLSSELVVEEEDKDKDFHLLLHIQQEPLVLELLEL